MHRVGIDYGAGGEKRHGKLRVIQHLSSADTETELSLLLEATDRVVTGEQIALNLYVTTPVRRPLLPTPRRQASVLEEPAAMAQGQPVERSQTLDRVYKALWSVLRAAYARLEFDELGDEVFDQLVLTRLVEPISRLDSITVLTELGVKASHQATIYQHRRAINEDHYRETIANAYLDYATTSGDVSLVL